MTIYAMSSYYLHITCFLYSGNLNFNKDTLIKYFYNYKCYVDSYSMSFYNFLWGGKIHCYTFGKAAWRGILYMLVDLVIRSLTMWSNSKRSPAQTLNVPEIPTFTSSLFSISYFFLLIYQFQSAYIWLILWDILNPHGNDLL